MLYFKLFWNIDYYLTIVCSLSIYTSYATPTPMFALYNLEQTKSYFKRPY